MPDDPDAEREDIRQQLMSEPRAVGAAVGAVPRCSMRRDLGCRMGNPEDRPPGPAKALCRVSEHGRLTQRERVAALPDAGHSPVLATELRKAVLADR